MTKGDYRSLLRYRALSVDICHQMGLYQSQENVASNPLEGETRKKVFWCQYVMDRYEKHLSLSNDPSTDYSIVSLPL